MLTLLAVAILSFLYGAGIGAAIVHVVNRPLSIAERVAACIPGVCTGAIVAVWHLV